MLESILIKGFQKHRNLFIEFDPHITVFVGPNDAGKSSAIRALKWLCTNKPKGNSFINWGKKKANVILNVDGHKIHRSKGTRNLYKVDGKSYRAFGSAPPDSVSTILSTTEANWQDQHDSIFQLSLSSGQIAKDLNKIINLEIIDRSLSKIASKVREAKVCVEINKQRLKKARESEKELSWIVEYSTQLNKLLKQESELEKYRTETSYTALLLTKATKAKQITKSLCERLQNGKKNLAKLLVRVREFESLRNSNQILEEILDEIEHDQERATQCKKQLNSLQQSIIQWKKENPLCPICQNPIPS